MDRKMTHDEVRALQHGPQTPEATAKLMVYGHGIVPALHQAYMARDNWNAHHTYSKEFWSEVVDALNDAQYAITTQPQAADNIMENLS